MKSMNTFYGALIGLSFFAGSLAHAQVTVSQGTDKSVLPVYLTLGDLKTAPQSIYPKYTAYYELPKTLELSASIQRGDQTEWGKPTPLPLKSSQVSTEVKETDKSEFPVFSVSAVAASDAKAQALQYVLKNSGGEPIRLRIRGGMFSIELTLDPNETETVMVGNRLGVVINETSSLIIQLGGFTEKWSVYFDKYLQASTRRGQ